MTDRPFGEEVSYPPVHHLLRALPAEFETVDEQTSLARVRIDPDDPVGATADLLVTVDVLCGFLVGRLVAPDWMATSHLALHVLGAAQTGTATALTEVRRVGRTSVVVAVHVTDGDPGGPPVAEAVVAFSRLPRRAENLVLAPVVPGERTVLGGLAAPTGAALTGLGPARQGADGIERTEISAWSRNSFGAMNGGVVAALVARAAAHAGSARSGRRCAPVDLGISYLAPAADGPLAVSTEVLRSEPSGSLVRVEVVDERTHTDGPAEPRPVVVAHVSVGEVPLG